MPLSVLALIRDLKGLSLFRCAHVVLLQGTCAPRCTIFTSVFFPLFLPRPSLLADFANVFAYFVVFFFDFENIHQVRALPLALAQRGDAALFLNPPPLPSRRKSNGMFMRSTPTAWRFLSALPSTASRARAWSSLWRIACRQSTATAFRASSPLPWPSSPCCTSPLASAATPPLVRVLLDRGLAQSGDLQLSIEPDPSVLASAAAL